jgi:hypothetical protein
VGCDKIIEASLMQNGTPLSSHEILPIYFLDLETGDLKNVSPTRYPEIKNYESIVLFSFFVNFKPFSSI